MADFYYLRKEYTWHVVYPNHKAPELLVHFTMYNCSLDLGCILSELVPRILSSMMSVQLDRITKVVGSQVMYSFIVK